MKSKYTPEFVLEYEELHRALLDQRDAAQLLASADMRVEAARKRVNELERNGASRPMRRASQ